MTFVSFLCGKTEKKKIFDLQSLSLAEGLSFLLCGLLQGNQGLLFIYHPLLFHLYHQLLYTIFWKLLQGHNTAELVVNTQ